MIGLVTEETTFSSDYDAIIGLAYPSFAEKNVQPFFDKLMEEEFMKQNVFSFFLSSHSGESSELMLGGWDDTKFSQDISWHPVVDKKFWSLKLDDILIDGKSLGYCSREKNCMVTPDSGASQISFPPQAFMRMSLQHGKEVECETDWEFEQGDLTFVINEQHYQIESQHWNRREITKGTNGSKGKCKMAI